ncbi:MAG: PilZ domain-containing protein [Deltaproteobacteria bacterium]|nr:PilZ domain-containing protein [Deltaproteobacteria bacterium]
MSTEAPKRPPVVPLVEVVRWEGRELDVHTLDRGAEHGFILTNLYAEGQLLVTRRVPYLPRASGEFVLELMTLHQGRMLSDLRSGVLDRELRALFAGNASWTRHTPPPAPLPMPPPAPLPQSFNPVPTPARPVTPPPPPPPAPAGPPRLLMVLDSPQAFLEHLFTDKQVRGILVDCTDPIPLGSSVEVAVRFLGRPIRQFYVHGKVTARRSSGKGAVRGDVAVTVAPDEVALDRVTEFARGIHDPTTDRQAPRVHCALAVRVEESTGRVHQGRMLNISEGGAMLGKMPPLMEGVRAVVHFTLPAPFGDALAVPAEVRWFRADGQPVFGVRFQHDGNSAARVGSYVASLLKVG